MLATVLVNVAGRVSGSDGDTDSTTIITAAAADRGIVWTTARYAPASTIIVSYPVYRACDENLTSTCTSRFPLFPNR